MIVLSPTLVKYRVGRFLSLFSLLRGKTRDIEGHYVSVFDH